MYKIGNLTFDIYNLTGNQSIERLIPFVTSEDKSDLNYEIKYCADFSTIYSGKEIFRSTFIQVFQDKQKIYCIHMENNIQYAVTEETKSHINIYLLKSYLNQQWHHYFLLDLLHLERPLLKKKCFVLHCSYITTDNSAILFTAPSGGGKTTQANLWKKYKRSRIINGDKAIIGYENKKWYAYGLPLSGSSSYYLNEKHIIKAIIILEKSKRNILYKKNLSGFSKIWSQTILNVWDEEFCEKAMELVVEACAEIPIFLYQCTKSPSAVHLLYKELFKKE